MPGISIISTLFRALFSHTKGPGPETLDRIFFGLGNSGPDYEGTRHNIGFSVVDAVACLLHSVGQYAVCHSAITIGTLENGTRIALVKPQTYVNKSGDAIASFIEKYKVPVSSCIVIVDDFNLPTGVIRTRKNGSDGGHNGLKSIIGAIGQNFPRMRVGIGPKPTDSSIIDFVLGKFSDEQLLKVREAVKKSVEALLFFSKNDIEAMMSRFNK